MNAVEMVSYIGREGDNICFSLPGVLTAVPVRYSLPAPDLNFDFWFSVSSEIHTELQFIQNRIEHFFISVSGLFRTAYRKKNRPAIIICRREISVLRIRILKLSYAGRRL